MCHFISRQFDCTQGYQLNPAQTAKNGSIARVLIVDDNSDAARTTGMWLELRGHKVVVLTDSTQCLSRLDSFSPDVLLLDIAMPNLSGYDLAQADPLAIEVCQTGDHRDFGLCRR